MSKKQNISNLEKRFLLDIHEKIYQIAGNDAELTKKLQQLAFGILVNIDGESVHLPPFKLIPIADKTKIKQDIAGNLHNNFYSIIKNNESKKDKIYKDTLKQIAEYKNLTKTHFQIVLHLKYLASKAIADVAVDVDNMYFLALKQIHSYSPSMRKFQVIIFNIQQMATNALKGKQPLKF